MEKGSRSDPKKKGGTGQEGKREKGERDLRGWSTESTASTLEGFSGREESSKRKRGHGVSM